MNAYIWKDTVDKNQFCIGIKTSSGGFVTWISLFVDGFEDLFGKEIYQQVKGLAPGVPTPVNIAMSFEEQP